ncbi:hypothetical protein [Nocardia ignorata]|uniref:DUF2846 domain-containing protein n=1 Tax=Nocardia ignorata TaxID=145285 RepID=A0A4R6P5C4_NOCIG|nr:hypothetical protein [Nocardia ignorata]TDP32323.1 hypothetical protein DFR75_106113 [Nocardia ignorata]
MTGAAFPAAPQFRAVPGQTGVVVHTRKLPIAFGIGARVRVDGFEVPNITWGANFVPVPPGTHMLTVETTQWGMGYGSNHASVQVFPGHTTEVHYSAPAQIYMKGALGVERQATPGVALSYVALAFCVLLVVDWIALAI